MTNGFPEHIRDAGIAASTALQQVNAINTMALTRLTDLQFRMVHAGVDATVEQARLLTDIDDFAGLYTAESRLVSEYAGQLLQFTHAAADIFTESQQMMVAAASNISAMTKAATVTAAVAVLKPASRQAVKPVVKKPSRRKANKQ